MNEYDKRQLDLMIQKIHAFKEGTLYFSSLINDLDALLRVLTFEDQEWKNNFSGYWFDLEQVYAVALDENRTHFDSEDQKILREAIQNLEMMVNTKLEIYYNQWKCFDREII